MVNIFCMWEDYRGILTFEKLWFVKSLIPPSLGSILILFSLSMGLNGRFISDEQDEQNMLVVASGMRTRKTP